MSEMNWFDRWCYAVGTGQLWGLALLGVVCAAVGLGTFGLLGILFR